MPTISSTSFGLYTVRSVTHWVPASPAPRAITEKTWVLSISCAEAGKDLGASEWEIFRDILLPYLRPGIVAGALLAFTLSLDDFVITFFTAGPETITFPVKVYSMVRFSVTPEVNAASTVLILVTVILTSVALWLQSRGQGRATG